MTRDMRVDAAEGSRPCHGDSGFTLVELMVVVLIVGVLVAIAIPVYQSTIVHARRSTCFANQRTIESAAAMWRVDSHAPLSAGIIDKDHDLMNPLYLKKPPRCPSAPSAADPDYPTVAEGAYTLEANGNVRACTLGDPVHGSFMSP